MELLTFIALTFVVYRISTDLAWMSGPFHVFDIIRGLVLQKFGLYHWITEGVNCPICLSFWFAMPLIYTNGWIAWLSVAGSSALFIRIALPKD